ncbi:carboxymuconolactone decarboxylase family protein [Sphingomonas sp.]|uniref:carboxymuconolactone decarboxylase family protein n=1 Tax=Sphingomonas sp. TaxID=28214 RepID=UPI003BA8F623
MLHPLPDSEWPAEIADMREGFAGKLNVYRVMAHHPALLRAWSDFRNHVVTQSALTPIQSELVILRTGYRHRSRYEWAHHVARGLAVGLSDQRINATARGAEGNEDGLLIAAVDALLDHGKLSPALLDRITRKLGTPAVLDIISTVGMYTTLAFLIETFQVPIDRGIDPVPLP